jgi:hypothetical protein
MKKRAKLFLPRWVLWVMLPVLVLVWGIVTYTAFATTSGRDELGAIGWLLVSLVLLAVGVMLWLMGSGRLPAYILEIEEVEDQSGPRNAP